MSFSRSYSFPIVLDGMQFPVDLNTVDHIGNQQDMDMLKSGRLEGFSCVPSTGISGGLAALCNKNKIQLKTCIRKGIIGYLNLLMKRLALAGSLCIVLR